jgi:hypothetical protein
MFFDCACPFFSIVNLFVQQWIILWAEANFVGGWQGCF